MKIFSLSSLILFVPGLNETNNNETIQEGCGNGICEINESWESCPADCGVEGSSTEVSADLSLTEISQEENKTFSLLITNSFLVK